MCSALAHVRPGPIADSFKRERLLLKSSIASSATNGPRPTMSALGQKRTCAVQKSMSALPRKRSALGDSRIFLDAFVIGDQPEGKAKDHSDVVYN